MGGLKIGSRKAESRVLKKYIFNFFTLKKNGQCAISSTGMTFV